MKAGLLAFGALVWTAPVLAQAQDPLAPLPSAPPAAVTNQPSSSRSASSFSLQAPSTPAQTPVVQAPARTVPVPRDWRGVFDAIDSGNWASASAGIAALPLSVLTPIAKAELYTAKGSPVVDLGSLQALIAQSPEIPEANQLGLMAIKRGATTPPMVLPEKPTYVLGSAPVRYRAHHPAANDDEIGGSWQLGTIANGHGSG